MIPKSGYRFSEKIMLKQRAKAKCRCSPKSFRFSVPANKIAPKLGLPGREFFRREIAAARRIAPASEQQGGEFP
jgi:hypothetical protein